MVLPHEVRKANTVMEQIIQIPKRKIVEVQNVLASSVKVFQLTNEVKELARKSKVALQEYENSSSDVNSKLLAELLINKKKAKEELSLSKREFMQHTDAYIALGGDLELNEKEEKKGTV